MLRKLLSALGIISIFLIGEIGGGIGKIIGKAAFAPSNPNEQQVEKKLIEGLTIAANQLNQQLPIMVDEDTRLDRATVGPGARSVYHYTFPNITSKEIDSNWLYTNLRPAITRKVCSSKDMEMSLRYGATYIYSYSGSDGNEIARFEIDRNGCSSGAPMQATPVESNYTLKQAEIRYCLAEDIRLNAAKGEVSKTSNYEISFFNKMIADYNNRCGKFSYSPEDLERAKSEIEPIRAELESEGRERIKMFWSTISNYEGH
jgi:hypothetical protein